MAFISFPPFFPVLQNLPSVKDLSHNNVEWLFHSQVANIGGGGGAVQTDLCSPWAHPGEPEGEPKQNEIESQDNLDTYI
jgi:hypothetical protein